MILPRLNTSTHIDNKIFSSKNSFSNEVACVCMYVCVCMCECIYGWERESKEPVLLAWSDDDIYVLVYTVCVCVGGFFMIFF